MLLPLEIGAWEAPHHGRLCSNLCTVLVQPGAPIVLQPLQEPFVELMKGSLNTFLNAFTYPDRTCYPVRVGV